MNKKYPICDLLKIVLIFNIVSIGAYKQEVKEMIAKKAKNVLFKKDYFYREDTIEDIYDNDFLSEGLDSDMISPEEQCFMMGYLGDCYV